MIFEGAPYDPEGNYSIELSDGTIINGLGINGTCFCSKEPIDPSIFEGKLNRVYFSDGESRELHEFTKYIDCGKMDELNGGYYLFAINEIPKSELKEEHLNAKIDYLAMINDVDFEGGD